VDNGLIEMQAMAIRAICGRLTSAHLQGIRRSVEQACLIPKHLGWDRRATAHAEIFALLADAADDPVLAQILNSGTGISHYLMITAGPSAAGVTANSRKRLLAYLTAHDPDGAACEMEDYLRILSIMGRLTAPSPQGGTAPHGETADRIA
jgi:DNA-binding GntR family transcriptional regulator